MSSIRLVRHRYLGRNYCLHFQCRKSVRLGTAGFLSETSLIIYRATLIHSSEFNTKIISQSHIMPHT